MKKFIFILIFSLSGLNIQAQDHIIIPAGQDTLYRVNVTWYYGIDPIQTKDGNYIIPAKVLTDLQAFEAKERVTITQKRTAKSMTTELEKLPVKDIRKIGLKTEVIEQIIRE